MQYEFTPADWTPFAPSIPLEIAPPTVSFVQSKAPESAPALAESYAGTEPRNVFVTLTEHGPIDWSLGNGVAQYAPADGG